MNLTRERYDKNCQRIKRGDTIIGMLLRLSNDRWGIYSPEEVRLTPRTFASPQIALNYATNLFPERPS